MTTADIIAELNAKFSKYRNAPSMPCVDQYRYVRGQWIAHGVLHDNDWTFINDLYNLEAHQLRNKAFMLGKWYDIEPKCVQYYNLVYDKPVKKCIFK